MTEKELLSVGADTFLALPVIDTSVALRVCRITSFAPVKAKLRKLYGDVEVTADGKKQKLSLLTAAETVEIEALPFFAKNRYNAADVVRVTARLTREGDGCPWDRAQTHESIRINMIEEAYEAVDAIDKHDVENMCEEFGDVFLQSALQSDIAARAGEFDFDDVCDGLCKKLIGRHTFIFGDDRAGNADDALGFWEKAKAKEKHYDDVKAQLSKLPDNFPALLLAQKTHKKLKKAGAACEPKAMLEEAVEKGDFLKALMAACACLSDEGRDAEVELNKLVKAKIASL